MSIKMISYDLHKPGQNYDNLIDAIKSYNGYCKINESDWLISTADSCSNIRDFLKKFIDTNDTLFVAELSSKPGWWASYNLRKGAVDWLNSL